MLINNIKHKKGKVINVKDPLKMLKSLIFAYQRWKDICLASKEPLHNSNPYIVFDLPRTQASLSRWKCARKRGREGQQSISFPWSLAVHHLSLAFRFHLYDAKNEAPEEEAGIWQQPCTLSRTQIKAEESLNHLRTYAKASSKGMIY